GSKSLAANASQWRRVYELYKQEQPDLVHNFTIKCVLFGGAAARQLGIPCINAVPGRGYVFTDNRLSTRVIRAGVLKLYRYACSGEVTQTIFQNEEDLQFFVKKKVVPADRAILIRGSGANCVR